MKMVLSQRQRDELYAFFNLFLYVIVVELLFNITYALNYL